VLPVTAITEVVTLDEKQTTRLRGPRADPAARLYSRPYLKRSVYLAVDPATDPTVPYWLIGTRHPRSWPLSSKGAGRKPVTNQWHDYADEASG